MFSNFLFRLLSGIAQGSDELNRRTAPEQSRTLNTVKEKHPSYFIVDPKNSLTWSREPDLNFEPAT